MSLRDIRNVGRLWTMTRGIATSDTPITFSDLFALRYTFLRSNNSPDAAKDFASLTDRADPQDAVRVFAYLRRKQNAFEPNGSIDRSFHPKFMRSVGALSRVAADAANKWCSQDVQIAQTGYGSSPEFRFYESHYGTRLRTGLDSMMTDMDLALNQINTPAKNELLIYDDRDSAGLLEIFKLKPAFVEAKDDFGIKVAALKGFDEPTLRSRASLLRNYGFRRAAILEYLGETAATALRVMEKRGMFEKDIALKSADRDLTLENLDFADRLMRHHGFDEMINPILHMTLNFRRLRMPELVV